MGLWKFTAIDRPAGPAHVLRRRRLSVLVFKQQKAVLPMALGAFGSFTVDGVVLVPA